MVYADPNVTDVACAGLNGMRMGERVLTVRRATEVMFPSLNLHDSFLSLDNNLEACCWLSDHASTGS